MKPARIQRAFDAVHAIPIAELREAESGFSAATLAVQEARSAQLDAAMPHTIAIRRAVTTAMRPHRIEWRSFPDACISRDGRDNTISVWLGGTLYPATAGRRFALGMRVTLPFDLYPKDAEGLAVQVHLLKQAADAIRAAGY